MKQLKKWLSGLLVCGILLAMLPISVSATSQYTVNGVTIPVWGTDKVNGTYREFYDYSASFGKSQCWAFAQMVYKQLWNNQAFTSYRGTSDDILRNVGTGSARAITAGNTKSFIQAAKLGSVIRIASDIEGADGVPSGTYKHSFILVQKDDKGFTVYHSGSTYVRLQYFTWEGFAAQYANRYKYFKYIKSPNAAAYSAMSKPSAPTLSVNKATATVGEAITFTASASDASYYKLTAVTPSGKTVTVDASFSSSTTFTPSEAGTYTFTVTAGNGAGTVIGASKSIAVAQVLPDLPDLKLSTEQAIVGQTVTITYGGSTNAEMYRYAVKKGGQVYQSGSSTTGKDLYLTFTEEGAYKVEITAENPLGSTTASANLTVQGRTASGQCGVNATWSFDSTTGLLAISGSGAINDYTSTKSVVNGVTTYTRTAPWYFLADKIETVEIGEGITVIGEYAFIGLQNLEWITLPEATLTTIKRSAFCYCEKLKGTKNKSNLEWLVIPPSVQTIEDFAFGYTALSEVYFNQNGNIPTLTETTFAKCSENLVLIGQAVNPPPYGYNWALAVQDVKVSFDPNGGNDLEKGESVYLYASNYKNLPIPKRTGYTFLGWYTKPNGGTLITEASQVWNPIRHTLYAHWEKNDYSVQFLNGEETVEVQAVGYMEQYNTLPNLLSEDAELIGWSTAVDGGELVTAESYHLQAENQTLYAVWEAIPEEPSDEVDVDESAIIPVLPTTATATPTGNTLLVDGTEKLPAAYMINDNNYFKLRDVAALLNGTQAQFNIGWDGVTGAITITTGEAYTAVGGELAGVPTDVSTAEISNNIVYVNGEKAELTAYMINDNNYFKLRDLGKALGFNVSWDGTKGAVLIESNKPYSDAD